MLTCEKLSNTYIIKWMELFTSNINKTIRNYLGHVVKGEHIDMSNLYSSALNDVDDEVATDRPDSENMSNRDIDDVTIPESDIYVGMSLNLPKDGGLYNGKVLHC